MAKQSTKSTAKTTGRKKAAPAAAPTESSVSMDQSESGTEVFEAAAPAVGELPPAAANEAAGQLEISEADPESGAAPGEVNLPKSQAAPEGASEPEGRRAEVRSPKGLNLRAGPALNYEALEVLADGMEVTVLALPRGVTVPGWELVMAGERAGWCSARFLRPLED